MGGVYGDTLTAFSEQMRTFPYFDMQTLPDAGFGPRTSVGTTRGVFQCTRGRDVKNSQGNLVVTRGVRYWTRDVLVIGRFVQADGITDAAAGVYRVGKPDNSWVREGGFTVYDMELVVGNDGKETVAPAFDLGERELA